MVGGVFGGGVTGAAVTLIAKVASAELAFPSLTLIVIEAVDLPASVPAGVPESKPDAETNVAQFGLLLMLKVSASPSASEALGWNL